MLSEIRVMSNGWIQWLRDGEINSNANTLKFQGSHLQLLVSLTYIVDTTDDLFIIINDVNAFFNLENFAFWIVIDKIFKKLTLWEVFVKDVSNMEVESGPIWWRRAKTGSLGTSYVEVLRW